MKKLFAVAPFLIALLAACSDGVPKIDDPHNVIVDGQKMTQAAFLEKYCIGKGNNETCLKVDHAKRMDATKGAVPRF